MAVILAHNWWTFLLRGILAVLFGVLAFVWPGLTLTALALLFGAYALVDGAFAVLAALKAPAEYERWWVLLLEGVVGVAVGLLTFYWPDLTVLALLYFIAAWAVVTGALKVIVAVRLRKTIANEWLLILSGAISILFGLMVMVVPAAGALAVVWLIGIYAVVYGAFLLALAFRMRQWGATAVGL